MAGFCLDRFNDMNNTHYRDSAVWLEYDFCESCAAWRPCVMELHPKPLFLRLMDRVRNIKEARFIARHFPQKA